MRTLAGCRGLEHLTAGRTFELSTDMVGGEAEPSLALGAWDDRIHGTAESSEVWQSPDRGVGRRPLVSRSDHVMFVERRQSARPVSCRSNRETITTLEPC